MKDHNKYYWDGKQKRADQAAKHTENMAKRYCFEIEESVDKTLCYTGPFDIDHGNPTKSNVTMEIVRADSVSALMQRTEADGRVALLNFASYKHPGGGFTAGSRAQEESLCHESFLYNVLKEFEGPYYDTNKKDLNKGLYRDRALYSPGIIFERDGMAKVCDVVTCASPNFSVAERHVSREVNNVALRKRVRFILEIAKLNDVNTFIVGAWGCGVFQQDPNVVAKYFEEESQNVFADRRIKLVFAVIPPLPNQTDNLTPFVKMVERWHCR